MNNTEYHKEQEKWLEEKQMMSDANNFLLMKGIITYYEWFKNDQEIINKRPPNQPEISKLLEDKDVENNPEGFKEIKENFDLNEEVSAAIQYQKAMVSAFKAGRGQ